MILPFLLALSVTVVSGQSAIPAARLAVLTTEPAVSTAADLITVELSRNPGVLLLERAQVETVFAEQSLSASHSDYVRLGSVLNADGLLVLGIEGEGTNRFLSTRLVAARPGVLVKQVRSPWPLENRMEWAQQIRAQIEPLFTKLTLQAGDAVPLSVVNLRSSVRSAGNESVERQLTLLLIHRLAREREIFVLERQHLDKVLFEQELRPELESSFWTGRYLLDGVLDERGYDPNSMTLNARLISPEGVAVPIELSGPRTNLSELVESLAARVLSALQLRPGTNDWRPLEEAEQYFQEARWALRWKLYPVAQAASEAAWALGHQTQETATLRIQSYIEGYEANPFSVRLDVSKHTYVSDSVRGRVYNTFPRYRQEFDVPDVARLPGAIRALRLFAEDTPRFPMTNAAQKAEWVRTGVNALDFSGVLLEAFHRQAEFRPQAGALLAELRHCAREAGRVMPVPMPDPAVSGRPFSWQNDEASLWNRLRWCQGSYWHEKPEDVLPLLQQVLEENWQPEGLPRIIAWSWSDRMRIPALTRQFVSSLAQSTNPAVRLEGLFLAVALEHADPEGRWEPAMQQLADEFWNRRNDVYRGRLGGSLVQRLEDLLVPGIARGRSEIVEPFTGFRKRLREDYLVNAEEFNRDGFINVFTRRGTAHVPHDEAAALVPLFPEFVKRLNVNSNDYVLVRGESVRIREAFDKPDAVIVSGTTATPPEASIDVLSFKPLRAGSSMVTYRSAGASVPYRNGRLWFLVNEVPPMMDPFSQRNLAFIAVDPQDGTQQRIPCPRDLRDASTRFAVTSDSIYMTKAGGLLRFRFKDQNWESIEAPVPKFSSICEIDGSIYLSSADAILRFEPASGVIHVVASGRRRPALHTIDALMEDNGRWGAPAMFSAAGGLGILAQNRLFTSAGEGTWDEVQLPPFSSRTNFIRAIADSNRTLLEVSGNRVRVRLVEFDAVRRRTIPLLEQRSPLDTRDVEADKVLGSPRWRWPRTIDLQGAFPLFEEDTLWVLSPQLWWQRDKDPGEVHLLRFRPELRDATCVRLRFERDGKSFHMIGPGWAAPLQGEQHLTFQSVPQGWLVCHRDEAGYWLIPRPLIESRMAEMEAGLRQRTEAFNARQKSHLNRVDFNGNGLLDPDELTTLHLYADCLEQEREDIDLDGNGMLDADELLYFDANRNNVFEELEQEGIRLFHGILADLAIRSYDTNYDGTLNPDEWAGFTRAASRTAPNQMLSSVDATVSGVCAALDADGSGGLSTPEIVRFMDRRFDAFDLAHYNYSLARASRTEPVPSGAP